MPPCCEQVLENVHVSLETLFSIQGIRPIWSLNYTNISRTTQSFYPLCLPGFVAFPYTPALPRAQCGNCL